ncbi:Uncharacterised protein [Vibrio cholerae]|nr:Uncharacterised protein [Vibrio cholerae]
MTWRKTFVTEVTVNFEYTIKTTDNQTLQVQLRRDTQVHRHVERVVVRDEWARTRTTRDHVHHRRFHFHELF